MEDESLGDRSVIFIEKDEAIPSACKDEFKPDPKREKKLDSFCILIASFLMGFLSIGSTITLGVFHQAFQNEFTASTREITTIYALTSSTTFATGLIASTLTTTIGFRMTFIIGSILACLGYFFASFATEIWHLQLTLGLLHGLGCGFCFSPSIGILGFYFEKYRDFSTVVAGVGPTLGVAVFPFMHNYLLQQYMWRGTLLIESAVMLHLVICALLMKDPPIERLVKSRRSGSLIYQLKKATHAGLLRKPVFYFTLIQGLCMTSDDIFVILTPAYMQSVQNWSPTDASLMITVSCVGSVFSQISLAFLTA